MHIGIWRPAAVVAVAAGLAVGTTAGAANATGGGGGLHVERVLSGAYVGPLQFAVKGRTVVVADDFASTLNVIGRSAPIATGPDPSTGGDLAGVDIDHATGDIGYTTAVGGGEGAPHTAAAFTVLHHGHAVLTVDLFAYEKAHNPDGRQGYGIANATACQTAALDKLGAPADYTGTVDPHPYAVASLGHGSWAIADAGGNDLLKVDRHGHVSTLAVFPAVPVTLTQDFVDANAPGADCLVGATYRFEAVPTDVEVGPHGRLLVSTLSAASEVGLPAGSVYSVAHHCATRIATGFAGATNLAVTPSGRIFVAQLDSGEVAEVVHGQPVGVLAIGSVVGLEAANGHLYASTAPLATGGSGNGQVLELSGVH